jgi:hypothetical protein
MQVSDGQGSKDGEGKGKGVFCGGMVMAMGDSSLEWTG